MRTGHITKSCHFALMMSFAGAVHMVGKLRASPRLATNGDSQASGKEPSNLGKAKIACSLAPATFLSLTQEATRRVAFYQVLVTIKNVLLMF